MSSSTDTNPELYVKDVPPLNTPSRGGPFAQVAQVGMDSDSSGTRGGEGFFRIPFGIRLYRFTGVDMLVEVVDSPMAE